MIISNNVGAIQHLTRPYYFRASCTSGLQTFGFRDGEKSNNRAKILTYLLNHPQSTQSEIQSFLGINKHNVEKVIARLKDEGLFIREGSDRSGKWIVIDKDRNSEDK